MAERPYSRVYHEILYDPKFDGVREDVRHLGTWLLLLIVGEGAYPAPAFLPRQVPKTSLRVLVERGLVEELPGGRFQIHGLAAERERRSGQARDAAHSRWNAVALRSQSGRNPDPMLDETRLDKTRLDEQPARDDGPYSIPEFPVLQWIRDEGLWIEPASKYHRMLIGMVEKTSADRVIEALERMKAQGAVEVRQYVFGVNDLLFPVIRPDPRAEEKRERAEEQREASDARYEATQRLIREQEDRAAPASRPMPSFGEIMARLSNPSATVDREDGDPGR